MECKTGKYGRVGYEVFASREYRAPVSCFEVMKSGAAMAGPMPDRVDCPIYGSHLGVRDDTWQHEPPVSLEFG
jgi:hypothetical protein